MIRIAVFPGQGAQAVGMGKALHDAFPAARAVFEEVDEALGERLSALVFAGPVERLTLTANAQPALMATSLAAVRALETATGKRLGDVVGFVAGHSLGEYSALAAAGAIGLGDAARLLRLRGQAMQDAVAPGEGAMAAILGADVPAVEEIARAAAAEGGAIAATPFTAPAVPVIANVTADLVQDPQAIRALLVRQVTARVRWRESMAAMARLGVGEVLELGAGKVLAGLAKRGVPGAQLVNVAEPADVAAAAARLAEEA
jgi:[acyl-carrier-protein] S-malonyltransferase